MSEVRLSPTIPRKPDTLIISSLKRCSWSQIFDLTVHLISRQTPIHQGKIVDYFPDGSRTWQVNNACVSATGLMQTQKISVASNDDSMVPIGELCMRLV